MSSKGADYGCSRVVQVAITGRSSLKLNSGQKRGKKRDTPALDLPTLVSITKFVTGRLPQTGFDFIQRYLACGLKQGYALQNSEPQKRLARSVEPESTFHA